MTSADNNEHEECIGAKYFQGADDDDLMSDDDKETFSWRGTPEITHSDWTIIIHSNDDSHQEYHVHKGIMVTSCKYFSALFGMKVRVPENEDRTSRITLERDDEAKAFPMMLDHVYSPDTTLEGISTENAVALRSLARYFRCRKLVNSVNDFVQQDLSPRTAVTYLEKAYECKDETLEESARKLIMENFNMFCSTQPFVKLPVELFSSLICGGLEERHHELASFHVHAYLEANRGLLCAQLLNKLTVPLTKVMQASAERLLRLIGQLDRSAEHQESLLALDRLVKLCTDSLAFGWRKVDTEKCLHEFKDPSTHCSGLVAIHRLSSAVDAAKVEVELLQSQSYDQQSLITEMESRIDVLERENRNHRRKRVRRERLVELDSSSDESVSDTSVRDA